LDAHAHSVIATNLPLTPYNVFQFCGDRMGMERIIRMLKDDYPFGAAPTGNFEANAPCAELSMLAYNLIVWFKRLCLPEDWQSFTLPTIRHRLLMIPGEFVKTHNIPTLRMPRNTLHQEIFREAQKRIAKLSPLV
ncbi:transposase, partial [Candidatus Peregrinibacteria bacterium]|nr:transposase [Candidatus Peregrinibacteria bacterium]